jgi:lysine 2,3-aminomutase
MNRLEVPATTSWQAELANSYADLDSLARDGLVTQDEALKLHAIGHAYQVRIPKYYAALMGGAPNCPIRMQALPSLNEVDPVLPDWAKEWSIAAFGRPTPWTADAIGDVAKLAAPRLTHRYGNRAILHLSSLCAMYCRFCFRKEHLNAEQKTLYEGSLEPAFEYLRTTPQIREVILTGGDPLSIPDRRLESLLAKLDEIAHLKHVRIHSRMAVTLPSRLTTELGKVLTSRRVQVALVSHFNHPKELTTFARERLEAFSRQGVVLYNQSVLLRGINDDAEILGTLFQELYESGVKPFYLHHPDWTPGTFHFRSSIEKGQALMDELAGKLSGPSMPHYVLDTPGGIGKVQLTSGRVKRVQEKFENDFGGALYEIKPPQTREGLKPIDHYYLYAEFWKR